MICNDNHNFPVKIPSHPYVLLKRSVLCNCAIEAENNFLLESIAACPGKPSALTVLHSQYSIYELFWQSDRKIRNRQSGHAHLSEFDNRGTSLSNIITNIWIWY